MNDRCRDIPGTPPWRSDKAQDRCRIIALQSSFVHDDAVTELDLDILRAVAAGRLPDTRLLTVELRRLEALGLIDLTPVAGRVASRVTARGTHAIEVANGEWAAS
jgi:hypothetical protein